MVDIGETVRRVASEFKAESREKDVELVIDVSPELGRVLTDERKLSRVISNLVQNAVKFTGSGMVKISAAPLEERRWMLEVIDTGIGISSSELNYIFEEFRQVDDQLARSYSGMGLGLAITRKLVELLEGEISVESKPNEGSRFRITWPLQVKARTGTGSLVTPDGSETASEQNERIRARAG